MFPGKFNFTVQILLNIRICFKVSFDIFLCFHPADGQTFTESEGGNTVNYTEVYGLGITPLLLCDFRKRYMKYLRCCNRMDIPGILVCLNKLRISRK